VNAKKAAKTNAGRFSQNHSGPKGVIKLGMCFVMELSILPATGGGFWKAPPSKAAKAAIEAKLTVAECLKTSYVVLQNSRLL